jgi:hypothetical protein
MIGIYTIERLYSDNATLQIVRSQNERQKRCSFQTMTPVREWDEIIVENDYSTRLFAGILEAPEIRKKGSLPFFTANSDGYRKLFDRLRVADTWEDELAGDIVRDIVADFAPGFSSDDVEDGTTVEKAIFNYTLPSETVGRVAGSLGYSWGIDDYKTVYMRPDAAVDALQHITTGGSFWENLVIKPNISSLYNSIIVRGGTYLSEEVIYTEVADGEKTQFVLPEKPHDVSVYVNSVAKTVGIQFGELTPTAEFQVNFNEKYIENGTLATLSDGDVLEVRYKFEVPVRVQRKNMASINALRALFPETNGEFQMVIHDATIPTRELAYNIAQQNLNKYSNTMVEGSFDTVEDIFNAGEVLNIEVPEFVGSAVIQSVTSRHVGGTLWKHTVNFATVLFGFEEFMRDLLAAKKIELIDGESLESSYDYADEIGFSEVVVAGTDVGHTHEEDITAADEHVAELNFAVEYVYGEYFPSSFADTKRVSLFDVSPFS